MMPCTVWKKTCLVFLWLWLPPTSHNSTKNDFCCWVPSMNSCNFTCKELIPIRNLGITKTTSIEQPTVHDGFGNAVSWLKYLRWIGFRSRNSRETWEATWVKSSRPHYLQPQALSPSRCPPWWYSSSSYLLLYILASVIKLKLSLYWINILLEILMTHSHSLYHINSPSPCQNFGTLFGKFE